MTFTPVSQGASLNAYDGKKKKISLKNFYGLLQKLMYVYVCAFIFIFICVFTSAWDVARGSILNISTVVIKVLQQGVHKLIFDTGGGQSQLFDFS